MTMGPYTEFLLGHLPRPPNVPPLRALWSLLDGIWGVLEGIWGVLVLNKGPIYDPCSLG